MKKLVCLALVLSLLLPFAVKGMGASQLWPFEKNCLVELETATWCGYCPYAEKALAQIQNEYEPSNLAIYALHYRDVFSNSSANARMKAYGSIATPTAIFNGQTYYIGGDTKCAQEYRKRINEQLSFYSPFQIRLAGEVDGGSLRLTATVATWKYLPKSNFFYTFMIGENEASKSGERAYWTMKLATPEPTGTKTSFNELSTYEFNCTYPLGASDPKNVYASFLVESFTDQNIYQNATWRYNSPSVESIMPEPGAIVNDPPETITFTMKDKVRDAGKLMFLDQEQNVVDATISVKDQTITVAPKSKLSHGLSYYCGFSDGKAGPKIDGKFNNSPIFTQFSVKAGTEPPPNPPTPPTPDPPTPPEPKPPRLTVEPLGFNLGKIDREAIKVFEFTISNSGDGTIKGEIKSQCDYLTIEPAKFDSTPAKIKCTIDPLKVVPGQDYRCMIDIVTDAGSAKVGINFSVPVKPPSLTFGPEKFELGGDWSKPLKITVANNGEGLMVTKASADQPWISVAPETLTNSGEFSVTIDSTGLAPGVHTGSIKLESTGLNKAVEIPVSIDIPQPKVPIVVEMVVGNKLAIVDGKIVELKVAPQVVKGTTLVPFRFVAESFRAEVMWDAKAKTVTMVFLSKNLRIYITENDPVVKIIDNGTERTETLSVPAKNIEGSLCVPIRFFAQALGAKTDWDSATKKITITWLP